ncbi:MAG: hypothetical protein ACFFE8_02075 [Candidatus Heimdallarchaeota archaeon]
MLKTPALSLFLMVMISIPLSSSSSTTSGAVFTDQEKWSWSYTEVLSDNSDLDSGNVDLKVDDRGNIHVVWWDQHDVPRTGDLYSDIIYRRWDISTQSWNDQEIAYSTNGNTLGLDPKVLIDKVGYVHVIWLDDSNYMDVGTDADIFYIMRDELTGVWGEVEVVTRESANTGYSADPHFAVDGNNDIHVVWWDTTSNLANSGTDSDIFYRKRFSQNNSWSTMRVISDTSNESSSSPQIAIDGEGTIHFVWDDYTSNFGGNDVDIVYRKYIPELDFWSGITVVSIESTSNSQEPSLITDMDSNIHVAWHDSTDIFNSGPDWDVFYRRYDKLLERWEDTTLVSEGFDSWSVLPRLAIDQHNNPSIAWTQWEYGDNGGLGDNDILYRVYDGTLDSWSSLYVISAESSGLSTSPAIYIDRSGFVHVAWVDDTIYQSSGADNDIFYKKLHGLPAVPTLEAISPNPSTTGIIQLYWNEVYGVINYSIYRNQTPVTSISELDPIATVTENQFIDHINTTEQHFYYAVVAENYDGLSQISNSEYVQVLFLPGNFGTNATDGFPNQTAFFDGSLTVTVTSIVMFLAVSAFRRRRIRR